MADKTLSPAEYEQKKIAGLRASAQLMEAAGDLNNLKKVVATALDGYRAYRSRLATRIAPSSDMIADGMRWQELLTELSTMLKRVASKGAAAMPSELDELPESLKASVRDILNSRKNKNKGRGGAGGSGAGGSNPPASGGLVEA